MRCRNTMGKTAYLLNHLYWILIAMIWYRNVLFRSLPGLSLTQSRWALWGLAGVCGILGIGITWKRRRNNMSLLVNVLLPFELYAIVTYAGIAGSILMEICLGAAILSIIWFFWVLWVNREKVLAAVGHGLMGSRTIFVCLFVLCWIPLLVGTLLGKPLLQSRIAPAVGTVAEKTAMEENLDVIANFHPVNWQTLAMEQRMDALQRLANIEAGRLGLPHELNVGAANLREGVAACYVDATHEILVDLTQVEKADGLSLLNSICHEAYHAYQHRLCDAWAAADAQYQQLQCFADAAVFAGEFADYQDGHEDFVAYYSMTCEETAREYAGSAQLEYQYYMERGGEIEDMAG